MHANYKKPSKINVVSVLLILALLAGIYCTVQFGPPYWRKWRVKSILDNAANSIYPRRLLTGDAESEFLREVEEKTLAELRAAGIDDPGLQVRAIKTPGEATVSAEYEVKISHPVINKVTTLRFRPYNTVSFGRSIE